MSNSNIKNIISEKYKYLFINEFGKNFELFEMNITELDSQEYDIDIEGDYFGSCDGEPEDIAHMLLKIDEKLRYFLLKYPINFETMKIDPDYKNSSVSSGLVLKFEYKVDELHKFLIFYRVTKEDVK